MENAYVKGTSSAKEASANQAYPSVASQETVVALTYLKQTRGMGLIVEESCAGKTYALRDFSQSLSKTPFHENGEAFALTSKTAASRRSISLNQPITLIKKLRSEATSEPLVSFEPPGNQLIFAAQMEQRLGHSDIKMTMTSIRMLRQRSRKIRRSALKNSWSCDLINMFTQGQIKRICPEYGQRARSDKKQNP
ncbi:hypothetical protein EBB07_09830 [Paenibacillaceae bacterium]|nr:hypothetical protein EBB07_09830 [Paenibacillaceae bacterium]